MTETGAQNHSANHNLAPTTAGGLTIAYKMKFNVPLGQVLLSSSDTSAEQRFCCIVTLLEGRV